MSNIRGQGPIIYRVELEKRRRGQPLRYETRNLTDWGAGSPGRLIAQAIEATSPARAALAAIGAPTDYLLLWRYGQRRSKYGVGAGLFEVGLRDAMLRNMRDHFGFGNQLNLRRLRKTVVVAHQRTPIQHTQATHDQVYVIPDPQTRAEAVPVIDAGVTDAIDHANRVFQARVSRAELDQGTDTATTSCSDYTHSPFGEAGRPCRASFLLCTACPNAVVTPRHLPRLAYLHQVIDNLRGVLSAEVWEHDWREHHARLLDLKQSPSFTPAEWDDALDQLTAADREAIDQLLTNGFDA